MPENKQSDNEERTNMVYLAGKLKFDPKKFDDNTRALIDVGLKGCIQVSIYTGKNNGNQKLAERLREFREGDFIKLIAMLRPYGVKDDEGQWKNNISIDVTAIKNDPPRRQREQRRDDDVPF